MSERFAMRRLLARYYFALKISAATLAPIVMPVDRAPAPIVRQYRHRSIKNWHPLEIVSVGNTFGVVTIPTQLDANDQYRQINPN